MDYVAASNAAHVFYRGASEAVRIDASSRLLVGTSTARSNYFGAASGEACQLEVEGNDYKTSGASFTSTNNSIAGWGPHIALGRSRGGSIGTNGLVSNGDGTGSIIYHGNDGSSFVQSARIDAFVDGTPGTNDMPGRIVLSTTADGASSPTERMRITQAGHVFVGNVTGDYNTVGISLFSNGNLQAVTNQIPTLVLNRKGSDGVIVDFYRDTNNPGTISVTTTATSYNTSSDYRLKENVTPVTDGITRLQQLKPSRFNFIAAPGCTVDGFIAHEVQSVVPEAITGEKDAVDADGKPQYQGIDQSKLVPLLTAALQETLAKIESLEARLTAAGI
ncbi:tail fiber domain-containing protein [bacterium]|nr:tail fiber domain-containing protein [bacterium]